VEDEFTLNGHGIMGAAMMLHTPHRGVDIEFGRRCANSMPMRFIALFLMFLLVSWTQAEIPELDRLKVEYGLQREGMVAAYEKNVGVINKNYALALDKLNAQARKQGNLEVVLAITTLMEAFDGLSDPADMEVVDEPASLRRLQQQVKAAALKDRGVHKERMAKLNTYYKGKLERLIVVLTQQNRIQDAVAVRAAIKAVEDEAPPPPMKVDPNKPLIVYSFDQVESGMVIDQSGYGNDGRIYEGLSFEPGVVGQAARFNGLTGGLRLPDEAGQYPTNNFSVVCWFKRGEAGNGFLCEINYADTNGDPKRNAGIKLTFSSKPEKANMPSLVYFTEGADGGERNEIQGPVLEKNAWYHLVAVREGTVARIYVNGQLTAKKDGAAAPIRYDATSYDDQSAHLGCWKRDGYKGENSWFDGSLDEFMLYQRALGAEEVRLLFSKAQSAFQ
jgi:hypothetical protein